MVTINVLILLTLITKLSADKYTTTNSNTVESPAMSTTTPKTPATISPATTTPATTTPATTTPATLTSISTTIEAKYTAASTQPTTKAAATPSQSTTAMQLENRFAAKDTGETTTVNQHTTKHENEETATCALDQPHGENAPTEIVAKETTPTEMAPKETGPQKTVPTETIPCNETPLKETAPKEASSKKPSPKEPSPKELSPKELSPKEPSPTEPAPKETTPVVVEHHRKPSLIQRMKFHGQHNHLSLSDETDSKEDKPHGPVPCTCGVFLSGQFKKGSKEQPKGVPLLTQEMDTPFMNNAMGNRQCTNKCLELIIKHLPKSSDIICATVDRDHVFKERAYLFIKNHSDKWHGTNLSAGREFCCRDNEPYKCPKN